jgi:diacylglycerol kinase family enzyme
VHCDGDQLFAGPAWQVTVACTGAFGGGAEVDADPHDGILDVVVVEATSRARLVVHAYGLRAGRIEGQRGVVTGSGRTVDVDTDGRTGFNIDGELVEAERLRLSVEPRAFEVVVG